MILLSKSRAVCLLSIMVALSAYAQGLHAIRPIPGYACMSLNLSEQQMSDPNLVVPVLAGPTSASTTIGQASSVVIATSPPRMVDGYVEVLRFNNQTGWMKAQLLKPWHNPGGSGQKCVPSLMSNGSAGLGFR